MDYEKFLEVMKKSVQNEDIADEDYSYYKVRLGNATYMTQFHKWYLDKHKEKKTYRYMITFTLDPAKIPKEDTDVYYNNVEQYIIGLSKSKQYDAFEWWQVREHTKKGLPHWHVHVKANKSIKKDFFRYYQRIYGLIDISKSRVEMSEHSINYMSKENDPIQIL